MESFIFNNVSSDDLGLIIKEMPPIVRPSKNIESIKVNGRNGNLHIDNGTYDSYNITISCIINDLTKLDQNKNILQGTGDLQLSTVPGRTFKATIKNQIDFSKYLRVLREFPLQLEIEPISYGSETTVNYSTNATLTISGNVDTYPTIVVYGTGTITINNVSVEVLETGITINCDLMEYVKNNINKNSCVILDEFPKLSPGNNSITLNSGITSISISYKEGWL